MSTQLSNPTNLCKCCGMPAGTQFYTHPYTNKPGADGIGWGEAASCLCDLCSAATVNMKNLSEFVTYKRDWELKNFDHNEVQEVEVL